MARLTGRLTKGQRNKEVFEDCCQEIRELGVNNIAATRLISRTTVYAYMRRVPVNKSTEDALIKAIEKCKANEKEETKNRLEYIRQALNA